MELKSTNKAFGGEVRKYTHASTATGTDMTFSVYVPPAASLAKCPVIYYLSGLTCTDDNAVQKGGAFQACAELGCMMVFPDTSPRGDDVPDDDAYDLGKGAGFYVDATADPWAKNFKMYLYVTQELPALIESNLPAAPGLKSICGHSMGGHGALTIALKSPDAWASTSAFAPICNPTECPWGKKAFAAYGVDGAAHDATTLLKAAGAAVYPDILIDQGLDDQFLEEQLGVDAFQAAAKSVGQKVSIRKHAGFDHSYFFISSFMADHVKFHADALNQKAESALVDVAVTDDAALAEFAKTAGKPIT